MKTKFLSLVALTLTLSACAGNGGGGGSATSIRTVEGVDKSGTLTAHGVQCFNADPQIPANTADFNVGYLHSLVIDGNTFTETLSSAGCQVQITGRVVFKSEAFADITNTRVISATNGSCAINRSLSNGAISPNSESITFSTNQSLPDQLDADWGIDADIGEGVLLESSYSDGQGGFCVIRFRPM